MSSRARQAVHTYGSWRPVPQRQRYACGYPQLMPKRQNTKQRPIDYVVNGGWPHAELEPFAPALFAQSFARNLHAAMGGRSLRETARSCDLDPMTVRAILRGERFPDSVSITKMELAFKRLLWPGDSERRRVMREMVSSRTLQGNA